jgi:hypothetical protein
LTPLHRICCYNDLVAALRARQASLGLADEVLDDVAGLTKGHTNKVLGPSRERGIGASTFEAYAIALAFDLLMVENPDKLARMRPYYEGRKESNARVNHPIGNVVLSRAMTKLRKEGWGKIPAEQRSAYARRIANARWNAT